MIFPPKCLPVGQLTPKMEGNSFFGAKGRLFLVTTFSLCPSTPPPPPRCLWILWQDKHHPGPCQYFLVLRQGRGRYRNKESIRVLSGGGAIKLYLQAFLWVRTSTCHVGKCTGGHPGGYPGDHPGGPHTGQPTKLLPGHVLALTCHVGTVLWRGAGSNVVG